MLLRKEHSAGLLPYSCMCSLFILLVDEAGHARVVKFNVRIFFHLEGYDQTVWLDEFESSKYYFWKICEQ